MATQTQAGEVLTLFEASKLLKVSEKTLSQQARAGAVPVFRIGKQWRFNRQELLDWARSSKKQSQAK